MKQAFSAGVSSPPFPRTPLHWVRILMSMALCGWQCLPLAAQEADTTQAVRSTFSISSAYFVNDYANNMYYVQFDLDLITASSRLSLYGYEKFSDHINGKFSRIAYYLGAHVLMESTGIFLSYHEWGHADRTVAMGGTARMSNCYSDNKWCSAPRNFLGYTGSQFFHSDGGGQVLSSGKLSGNSESGRAYLSIVDGAGVNNAMLIAEKQGEQHFLRGHASVFGQLIMGDQFSIANYGPPKTGDLAGVASNYRSTGVDTQIQEHDLRVINNKSLLSGQTVNAIKATYDFVVDGKVYAKPLTYGGFWVPNQYNYITSRGITRKWVSGYEWNDSTKLLGSYEYVVRGDSFHEPGIGIYKNFGDWDALVKVSGKSVKWANLETAFSKRINKNWKYFATAYVWDSRSLLGERNSLKLKDNKTSQASVGVAYEY